MGIDQLFVYFSGGTTTVIDLIKPDSDESLLKAFEKWQLWAEDQACCDFAFKLKIPRSLTNQMTDEMRELTMENYAINCFHASMADLNDEDLMEFLDRCTNLGNKNLDLNIACRIHYC